MSQEQRTLDTQERSAEFARWPRYRAAQLGFAEHWYPVLRSRKLRRRPRSVMALGQEIFLKRDRGKVYALHDRCPHRGIPLSLGRQVFPGTFSCIYHGWTYDLETGELVAALTDGADSPICGKVRVRTFPVEERAGMIWVYVGDQDPPPPLEDDAPEDFIAPGAMVAGRITYRYGNWRYAAENGFDEAHAKFLHRNALWMLFRYFPAWMRVRVVEDGDGWISRAPTDVGYETEYPGLGRWPKGRPWRFKRGGARVSIRMPGTLRVRFREWTHWEWYVPTDAEHHLYIQMMHKRAGPIGRFIARLRYWTYIRWLFHWRFNDQDRHMVELLPDRSHPERLFRPDASITAWRKLCEQDQGIEVSADARRGNGA
jgi:phenylpropionate dioxygenase-like ring-hydroxylating dioxygenase large terminal subunit